MPYCCRAVAFCELVLRLQNDSGVFRSRGEQNPGGRGFMSSTNQQLGLQEVPHQGLGCSSANLTDIQTGRHTARQTNLPQQPAEPTYHTNLPDLQPTRPTYHNNLPDLPPAISTYHTNSLPYLQPAVPTACRTNHCQTYNRHAAAPSCARRCRPVHQGGGK